MIRRGGAPSEYRRAARRWNDTLTEKADATGITKNCLDCGYILDGLPSDRCPECARTFDPADHRTYAINNPRGQPRRSGIGFLLVATAASILIVWLELTDDPQGNLFRPAWAKTQRLLWNAAHWTEFAVLVLGAILSRRNRYSLPFRTGMWIAAMTLGLFWGYFIILVIVWSH